MQCFTEAALKLFIMSVLDNHDRLK